ncbi:MAG: hypothetical protein ACQEVA_10070 [Myxococcota bacterium]
MNSTLSNRKKHVDQLLASSGLSDTATRELIAILTPDESGGSLWPELELILHIAEHDAVARPLRRGEVSEEFEEAMVQALQAVTPLLGERFYGPAFKVAQRARQRLGSERRKYALVADKLDEGMSREGAVRMLRNYVETGPAPMFVTRLRQRFGPLLAAAERATVDAATLDELVANDALVDALMGISEGDLDLVRGGLARVCEDVDVRKVLLTAAIESGTDAQRAVAVALAGYLEMRDLAPSILGLATQGRRPTALYAAVGGQIEPLMARNVFAQLLADASWNNPEEPDQELTEDRSAAIVTARCVLPFVGSPLDEVDEMQLSDDVATERLEQLPAQVKAQWAAWDTLLGAAGLK